MGQLYFAWLLRLYVPLQLVLIGIGAYAVVQADWLVVGDPPYADEDGQGQPFVEQAGVLLDNMLKAVGASRGGAARRGAHLSNVVKCRPPSGRLPQAAELAQCAHYLQREVALVQPKIILAMGRFAVQSLLRSTDAIGKLRGRVHHYQGVPLIVTYHPAYLLRNLEEKARAWDDLCLAAQTYAEQAAISTSS